MSEGVGFFEGFPGLFLLGTPLFEKGVGGNPAILRGEAKRLFFRKKKENPTVFLGEAFVFRRTWAPSRKEKGGFRNNRGSKGVGFNRDQGVKTQTDKISETERCQNRVLLDQAC